MFNVWMESVEFEGVVKNAWEKMVYTLNPDEIFREKLKNAKQCLKEWSGSRFGDID